MQRSLNEIEQTCRKAARGSGLPWGVADETGRAIRWLHTFQLDGVSSLVALLEECDHRRPLEHAPQSLAADQAWRAPGNVLSPIMAGLAVCDCIGLMQGRRVQMCEVVQPLLVAGFVGQSVLDEAQAVSISWSSVELSLCHDRLVISGDCDELYAGRAERLGCQTTALAGDGSDGRELRVGDTPVDAEAWEKLESRAWLTYVEATEASRLSGAGAGLHDND